MFGSLPAPRASVVSMSDTRRPVRSRSPLPVTVKFASLMLAELARISNKPLLLVFKLGATRALR